MARKQRTGALLPVKGLDTEHPSEYISEVTTPNCRNMTVERSILAKRTGTTLMENATLNDEHVMAGRSFKRGATEYVVRIGPTKVEEWNDGTSAWDDITGSDLTAANTDPVDTAIPLISGRRILVFTNYIDNIRKYVTGGNTADLGGTPPKAKFCEEYKSYLVLAYIEDSGVDYPQRVQWSNTSDPETWTGGNTGYTDLTDTGEDITGIKTFDEYLAVHKESCIYTGYLVSSSNIMKFDKKAGIGTIANSTIQNIPSGEQIFLSKEGITIFNGISAAPIKTPMNEDLQDQINYTKVKKSWSRVVREKNEYWLGVPLGGDTAVNTIFKYNYKTGVVHKDTRTDITCAFDYSGTSNPTWNDLTGTWQDQTGRWNDTIGGNLFKIGIFGDASGYCYEADPNVNNDNSVAIDGLWESKDFVIDNPGQLGRWQKMELWAKGSGVVVSYSTDSGNTWTQIEDVTLGADYPTDDDPDLLWFDKVTSKIRFRFRNDTAGETFQLKQFIIYYTEREYRG